MDACVITTYCWLAENAVRGLQAWLFENIGQVILDDNFILLEVDFFSVRRDGFDVELDVVVFCYRNTDALVNNFLLGIHGR